jgi:hypothetical protein
VTEPNPYAYHGDPPAAAAPKVLPARRRLSLVWALVGVVAAVGIGLGAGALAVPSDPSGPQAIPTNSAPIGDRRVGVPASFGAYERVRGAAGRSAIARVRAAMTTSDPRTAAFRRAAIGLYQRSPGGPQLLFVGNDERNEAVVGMIHESAPSQGSLDFLAGTGATAIQEYPAGPLGGSLRCGGPGRSPYPSCAWIDNSSFGWVVDYGGSSPAELAGTTRKLRRAAEH